MPHRQNKYDFKNGVPQTENCRITHFNTGQANTMDSKTVNEKTALKTKDDVMETVDVPDSKDYRFSLRRLWAFSGPGFLMSIAYLDPGNIESDLKSGAEARYSLLWILLGATMVGLFVQRLAARLGAVTGMSLAEACRSRFAPAPRYTLWIMLEVTIIGADMQEVIGTAIALFLLSDRRIPLFGGVLITIADTITFLLLDRYGLRKLEAFFALLIAVMAAAFGYQYIAMQPVQSEVLTGLFVPGCGDSCNGTVLLEAVGIVGALITPHNLYLHSSLVKTRNINRKCSAEVRDANRYYFIESAIALFISLIINIFVVSVFANGLYGKTNKEVRDVCIHNASSIRDAFPDNDELVYGDIYQGGVFLSCQFGSAHMYVYAIGLLAAGQSSTMSGTYTGQFVMEGFLDIHWTRWKRVLFTRSVAILPTVFVAIFLDVKHMSGMNDVLNALMSLQLPFALMTTFLFTSSAMVMGQFRNSLGNKIFMGVVSSSLIALNIYFLITTVSISLPQVWPIYLALTLFVCFYLTVLLYLALCLMVVLGCEKLTTLPFIGEYLVEKYKLEPGDSQVNLTQMDQNELCK